MYIYILHCSDNSYYTGVTNNIDKRLQEHSSGFDTKCYTFSRRPVKLVYFTLCDSPMQAIMLEKKIKGWSRIKKEALINKNWNLLHESAKCKNETSHEKLILSSSQTISGKD
jgi:putative endonuclease